MSKIEMFKSPNDKQFYFRIKGGNGKKIAQSEGYHNRGGVRKGIAALRKVMTSVVIIHDLTEDK